MQLISAPGKLQLPTDLYNHNLLGHHCAPSCGDAGIDCQNHSEITSLIFRCMQLHGFRRLKIKVLFHLPSYLRLYKLRTKTNTSSVLFCASNVPFLHF